MLRSAHNNNMFYAGMDIIVVYLLTKIVLCVSYAITNPSNF